MKKSFNNLPGWVIVLTLIFAWPVGLVLLVLKYSSKEDAQYNKINDKTADAQIVDSSTEKLNMLKKKLKNYKVFMIIQVILAVIFFCSMISDIVKEADDWDTGLYINIIAFGILTFLGVNYFKTNKLIKKIETYQSLILIRDIYDTQKLATYLSVSRAEVLEFVTYMIREKYLNFDIENDNLVKPKEYISPDIIFSIVCQSCGATNKYIKGKNNKCEYCGNILNLNKI